ncbi:MAG: protein kinase domain-containing protein [Streptosporangiaceae bacterium]|jgi:hypothetical protein
MTVQGIPEQLGPYHLVARLGEGGMGVVYLARHPVYGTVAVKALRSLVAVDPTARRRLAREVETMRRVRSPFVAEVIDADVTADPPYIVTRHVPGQTLDDMVTRNGPLQGQALARLARGLASALTAVHASGVVHRDLKPGNVMLVNGEPVVIDFGIAQVPESTKITMTGMFMGTPGYLAPEVIEGKPGGQPADVHSWGATVAFAATGRPPFGTGSFETIFYRIVQGQPDLSGMPASLAALVARALARDPAHRPRAGELAALAAALDPAALVPGAPAQAVPAGATRTDRAAGRPRGRAAARAAPPLPAPASTRPIALGRRGAKPGAAGIGAAGAAAGLGAAGLGAAGLGSAGMGAGGAGMGAAPAGAAGFRARGPGMAAAAAAPAADYRDVLPPVSYPPPRPAAAPPGAAQQPGGGAPPSATAPAPGAGPGARSPWSPLVVGLIVMLVALSVVLPLAGTAIAIACLVLLRAADLTGSRLARRRARQGPRAADSVLAGAYLPVALARSLVRLVLLSPLAVLSAAIVAAITIITVPVHPLPRALAYGAGTLVAFYGLGPGSGACRKSLAGFFGATGRSPLRTSAAFILVGGLALAAVLFAGSQPPAYWPAGNLSVQLAHMPGLHAVITDIRKTIVRLPGATGL